MPRSTHLAITSRVPYLEQLGVGAVWLSLFYPSALKDGGCERRGELVDPKIGTLVDFYETMAAFEKGGMMVIVDIVPNHSSDEHVWFRDALHNPKGSVARDRGIFGDGLGPRRTRVFQTGSACLEPVGDGQFFVQPDLDRRNPRCARISGTFCASGPSSASRTVSPGT
ncbi:hypothetical protein JCM24511_06140 [Saitozyma sp. JCM 24511]|nr:hypothetical protein JCM24511_06140 [Saitozyma sp. JCM 24511]